MQAEAQLNGMTPVWIASRIILSDRVETFFRHKKKALKKFDAEEIHDLRVASRRLREAFALFDFCYADSAVTAAVRKLKKVTRALGRIRNNDEAGLFFSLLLPRTHGTCREETAALVDEFKRKRLKALKKLEEKLRKLLPKGTRREFLHLVQSTGLSSPPARTVDLFVAFSEFGKEAFREQMDLIRSLEPQALRGESHEAQHRLRIAVKHFRYRLEIFYFLVEPAFPQVLDILKEHQDLLGKLHDLTVFEDMVEKGKFSAESRDWLLKAISEERARFFAAFRLLVETTALTSVCERVVSSAVSSPQ